MEHGRADGRTKSEAEASVRALMRGEGDQKVQLPPPSLSPSRAFPPVGMSSHGEKVDAFMQIMQPPPPPPPLPPPPGLIPRRQQKRESKPGSLVGFPSRRRRRLGGNLMVGPRKQSGLGFGDEDTLYTTACCTGATYDARYTVGTAYNIRQAATVLQKPQANGTGHPLSH